MGYVGDQKREYQRKWLQKRRQDWIDSQGGVCVVCGSDDRLEVDHIDRSLKTMEPASIWSRKEEVREKELENCQVLCYTHHLEKTNDEKEAEHGTHSRYTSAKHKCRCEDCRKAHAEYAKNSRDSGKKW